MRVKLLQDVQENGQIKTTVRLKRKQVIGWFAGTELEMSDATARKYIDAGLAEAAPAAAEEIQP
ncbi:MAG TPA: hypothetical protein PLX85_00555 [Dehalococcoidia bacterium]|mgnify:CR=1 FL=1|nr:hypothetical protein [Dehalococcoidia bacterium]